jgi:hypothetical protein
MDKIKIEVPKEAYEWLKKLMEEINGQPNRATATPYFYDLRYRHEDGSHKLVPTRQNVFLTERAARDYISNNDYALPKDTYEYLQWGGRNPELLGLLVRLGEIVGVPYDRK